MAKNFTIVLIFLILFSSCKSTRIGKGNIPTPTPITVDKEWTLEVTPNGLDNVGVVFAMDSAGNVTRIPAGYLRLATVSSPVALTQQKKTKDVSVGALANFFGIKKIDSTANASFQDTSHLNATFLIKSGEITAIGDDTISSKFNAKAGVIEDNIKFLGLENSKLYLILETIKSPNVSITFDKSKQIGVTLAAKFKTVIGLNGHFKPSMIDSTDLVYNGSDTLTVFYKLRAINVTVAGPKGTGEEKVAVSLGNIIKGDELKAKEE